MEEAYIVASVRSPLAKANRGSFVNLRIDDICAEVIKGALARVPQLDPNMIEDVMLGCAMPEGEQGLNIARNVSFLAGLPLTCGAVTINRFCASSLEAINQAVQAIWSGNGDVFIAGGVESMTHVPMGGFNPSLNPRLLQKGLPAAYIGMGETAENLAKKYSIGRAEQDKFALASHQKALAAMKEGKFAKELIPIKIPPVPPFLKGGDSVVPPFVKGGDLVIPPFEKKGGVVIPPFEKGGLGGILDHDEGPRADTTLEKLAELKPAFLKDGTVTAGNSSQMTDGAAAAVIMSKRMVKKLKIKPLARIVAMAVSGCGPEVMGEGPIYAVPKVLKRAGMKLKDIDIIELNEAFASQSLAVIKGLGLDEKRVNIHGGAIALGHPLGATGARIMATLLNALEIYKKGIGLETMCVGGGQGVATIVERL